jgi:light-regulated signal transduction histidine kinase (bacteriophytochrome)
LKSAAQTVIAIPGNKPFVGMKNEKPAGLIAKSIVEVHGGEIWFDTETGKGTNFTFKLPVMGACAGAEI